MLVPRRVLWPHLFAPANATAAVSKPGEFEYQIWQGSWHVGPGWKFSFFPMVQWKKCRMFKRQPALKTKQWSDFLQKHDFRRKGYEWKLIDFYWEYDLDIGYIEANLQVVGKRHFQSLAMIQLDPIGLYGCFLKLNGCAPKTPQNDQFFSRKPMVVWYHYFRKPPYRRGSSTSTTTRSQPHHPPKVHRGGGYQTMGEGATGQTVSRIYIDHQPVKGSRHYLYSHYDILVVPSPDTLGC